jgi:hypothetical protein
LCLSINPFTIFSRFSLVIFDIFSNSLKKSFKIFLDGHLKALNLQVKF